MTRRPDPGRKADGRVGDAAEVIRSSWLDESPTSSPEARERSPDSSHRRARPDRSAEDQQRGGRAWAAWVACRKGEMRSQMEGS
jgi:hypothetical protein